MKFHYYLFTLLLVTSILLIGGGFTGKVISESCCMGDSCSADNICTGVTGYFSAPTGTQSTGTSQFTSIIGFSVLVGSLVLVHAQYKHKKKYS